MSKNVKKFEQLIKKICQKIRQMICQNTKGTPRIKVFPGSRNLAPSWLLMLAVIFSITPILYQSSSVRYAHSQMQKRSMVYLS